MNIFEKVSKGLEYHLKELTVGKTCYECPYYGDNPCEIQLIANTIALLKEQEPRDVFDENETPINQLTRMRDAAELAQLIAKETTKSLSMDEEKRLFKLAHKHYCTLGEIRVQYKLSNTADEVISKIYLTLAQAEAEARSNETVKEI